MSDLIPRLASAMRPGEGLLFSVNALAGDRIELLLQPKLPEAPDLPDDAAKIRAALALPLRLTGTPAEVGDLFLARLDQFQAARADAADAFGDLMQSLKQATGEARQQAAAAPSPETTDDTPSAPSGDTPAAAAEAPPAASTTNPLSLI